MEKNQCIRINAAEGTVVLADMPPTLEDLQSMVANPIALGMTLENGDVLYVDDEAYYRILKARAFQIEGCVFLGNGVVVSVDPESGDDLTPKSTVKDITDSIRFEAVASTPSEANGPSKMASQ
jgi:hypothetical protein